MQSPCKGFPPGTEANRRGAIRSLLTAPADEYLFYPAHPLPATVSLPAQHRAGPMDNRDWARRLGKEDIGENPARLHWSRPGPLFPWTATASCATSRTSTR